MISYNLDLLLDVCQRNGGGKEKKRYLISVIVFCFILWKELKLIGLCHQN